MKTTLSFDKNAGQYRTDVDGKRFYLGGDPEVAEQRKRQLNLYRAANGSWSDESHADAKLIAKGRTRQQPALPNDADYMRAEEAAVRRFEPVRPAITLDDLRQAEISILEKRLAEVEAELTATAGPRVAQRSTVTVADVFQAWHQHRKETAVLPGTSKPTDAVRGEGTIVRFLCRELPQADLRLSMLDYHQLSLWCLRIAARPVSVRSGEPVSRGFAKEALKIIRRVIRWSSRTYGYRKPDDWEEATKVTIRTTKADQLRRMRLSELIYSNAEITKLYAYSLPSERLTLLLALNCGFRQREITALHDEEVQGDTIRRYRDKSDIFAEWKLWPETVNALVTTPRIKSRNKVVTAWNRLLDRVQKDESAFRRLSFKRLCKSGATAIRRIGGGEVASLYLSHGKATNDDLLESYAATDWSKLDNALTKWHDELRLDDIATNNVRTAVPLSKVEMCRELWREGIKVDAIVERTGLSRATCYRYKPVRTVEESATAEGSDQTATQGT